MAKSAAHRVTFKSYGLTDEGYGVFLFEFDKEKTLPLAVAPEQLLTLLAAVAETVVNAQERLQGQTPLGRAIRVESWSLADEKKTAILAVTLAGGGELRFALTAPANTSGGDGL
jgi:hypothetical protein